MPGTPRRNPAVDRDGLAIVNDLRIGNYTRMPGDPSNEGAMPPDAARAPVFLTGGLDLSHIREVIPENQRLPYSPMLVHLRKRDGDEAFGGEAFEALMVLWSNEGERGGFWSRALVRTSLSPIAMLWDSAIGLGSNGWSFGYDHRHTHNDVVRDDRLPGGPMREDFHEKLLGEVFRIFNLINNPKLITYEPATVGPHLLRRWERKPQQRIDYRVIRLPDGRLTHGRSVPVDGVPAGIALHTVRGHFATYTADAPLFGKLVGTYWKPATIRGSDQHGQVIKDYDVHNIEADL